MSDDSLTTEARFRLREVGTRTVRHLLLVSGENLVGSGRECSCRLRDRGISRRHARLEVGAAGTCRIWDLSSKNGTRVNGTAIDRGEAILGDEIAFGATVWRLEAVPTGDFELAVEIEVSSTIRDVTSIHEETLPIAERSTPLPPGVELPDGVVACASPAMRELYERLAVVRQGDVAVLIQGATGSGKEHLARAIHDGSCRGPFIAINCAAMPSQLLEAEMFGVGKGVATGVSARAGKIRQAHQGTLFLDEIGELEPQLQAKLLRVVQEREVAPLGERAQAVDVRFIAATNADLETAIAEGQFRADLYYRLAGYVLKVPPLCDRPEDLPMLAGFFLRRFNRETGKSIRGLTVKALSSLESRDWPGNVRELQNEMRRLVYECPDRQAIDSTMLETPETHDLGPLERAADRLELGAVPLSTRLETLERRLIERALQQTGGNRSATARLLGVSRNGLTLRLRRLDLES